MNIYTNFTKLRDLINGLEPEAVKAEEKGNKAAGRRLRKGLQEAKKQAQNLRAVIQEELKKA